MEGQLDDKVICITGASRGLGAAMAYAFDAAGATLVLGARNQQELSQVAADCRNAVAVRCDVRDSVDVNALVQVAVWRSMDRRRRCLPRTSTWWWTPT